MSGSPLAGVLLIDKPADWTSHDVVAKCRRLAGTRRVGHAGTLDPMATGLLILGVNQGTKLLTLLVGCDKTYTATIRLGQATSTDDAEGEVTGATDTAQVTGEAVAMAIEELTGAIQQVPSAVSAIKIKGERAYARARKGEAVELPARPVTVHRFEVHEQRADTVEGQSVIDLDVTVEVSSGTYVRALARDLGAALGVGGHLTRLRRTSVGPFDLAQAHALPILMSAHDNHEPLPLIPLAAAAAVYLPTRELSVEEADHIRHGRKVESGDQRRDPVAAVGPGEELVAILDESRRIARSHVVFPATEAPR